MEIDVRGTEKGSISQEYFPQPFEEYVSIGISHLVFYIDPDYELRRVKRTSNLIWSGLKIIKTLEDDDMTHW